MSILDDVKLDGKVAIVTGAGRGIGQASAKALAEGGARIVVADIDADPANETVATLKGMGAEAVAVTGNVSVKADVEKIVKTAMDTYGSLEIMANVAGITRDGMLHKLPEDQWDFVININLKGTFLCCQAAVNVMRDIAKAEGKTKKARKIINFSSVAGIYGNKGQTNYSAAKAGIIGATKALALELASRGITVNCVAPGLIETDMVSKEMIEGSLNLIPMRRPGTADEVAGLVSYLMSDEAGYVTRQVVSINGGLG